MNYKKKTTKYKRHIFPVEEGTHKLKPVWWEIRCECEKWERKWRFLNFPGSGYCWQAAEWNRREAIKNGIWHQGFQGTCWPWRCYWVSRRSSPVRNGELSLGLRLQVLPHLLWESIRGRDLMLTQGWVVVWECTTKKEESCTSFRGSDSLSVLTPFSFLLFFFKFWLEVLKRIDMEPWGLWWKYRHSCALFCFYLR